MTAKIRELINNTRALREAALKGPFVIEDNAAYCPPDYARFIAASPENQARLEAALLVAVEALESMARANFNQNTSAHQALPAIEAALRGEP